MRLGSIRTNILRDFLRHRPLSQAGRQLDHPSFFWEVNSTDKRGQSLLWVLRCPHLNLIWRRRSNGPAANWTALWFSESGKWRRVESYVHFVPWNRAALLKDAAHPTVGTSFSAIASYHFLWVDHWPEIKQSNVWQLKLWKCLQWSWTCMCIATKWQR